MLCYYGDHTRLYSYLPTIYNNNIIAVNISICFRITTFLDFRNSKQLENKTFRKLDLVPFLGVGRETPTLLGPLERSIVIQIFPCPHPKTETDPVSETFFLLI
jgi:hypothetical protein